LLGAAHDVRVGLVAFGDDSYTVSPLTEDVATVRALLPPLAPDIMPSAGDKLTPALDRAAELLQTVASRDRRVLLLSDGFEDPAAALNAAAKLHSQGITLDVIGIGTADGAPAPTADGHFAQDTGGRARLARLDEGLLRQLAGAGGGRYASLAEVPGMINSLQTQARRFAGGAESASSSGDGSEGNGNSDIRVQHWREGGIWLLPFVLMLTALLARRGWL
jgi:Ca-activated chloride channel family protein